MGMLSTTLLKFYFLTFMSQDDLGFSTSGQRLRTGAHRYRCPPPSATRHLPQLPRLPHTGVPNPRVKTRVGRRHCSERK